MMVKQEHSGSGDNVLGNKYENIIRSIQSRDLITVIDDIMRDICYRNLTKAREKLDVLNNINSLEHDVSLLLKSLSIKLELVKGVIPSSKNDLIRLLQCSNLSNDIRAVATSILIDFESRQSEDLARERYFASGCKGCYINEVFFERLASKEELLASYNDVSILSLSEQEISGLIRGAIRLSDFSLSFKLSKVLDKYYPSINSKVLLLYTESCLILMRNQNNQYISFSKQEKSNVDRLIVELLNGAGDKLADRQIAILANLLNLTFFMDKRLHELGKAYINEIREMSSTTAEALERLTTKVKVTAGEFKLTSDTIDLEQFELLEFALMSNQVRVNDVREWVERGGVIHTGNDYIDSFVGLYLSALILPADNKIEIKKLDDKAQLFLKQGSEMLKQMNPACILRLCDIFIEVNQPLNAVGFISPFITDDIWVSPVFECYLNALFLSEKFSSFLSKVERLRAEDKSELILLREAQIYERMDYHDRSINLLRTAINISPDNPHTWYSLLYTSRKNGANTDALMDIVLEIPDAIFRTYDESKIALVNEIANNVNVSYAEKILVDWFVQNPVKVAKPYTQIHANTILNRPEVYSNPYVPINCADGVKYFDGFETSTRILVRDVEANHPSLLEIESPLGQILVNLQEGETCGEYKMLERLPPYVAAFRLATELRSKSNDGTDTFRQFSLPSNEEEFIPYFENVIRRYDSQDKERDAVLHSPNVPLTIRGKFTFPADPVRAALINLTSDTSAKHLALFNNGKELSNKVIIDVYTAVYFSMMGFSSVIVKLDIEIIVSQLTKDVLTGWIESISREDYLSIGVSEKGLYRITSKDIQESSSELIQELQVLLSGVKVEALKSVDTPELLVKVRDVIGDVSYSTFQLSIANDIPLLCIDQLMCELLSHSGFLIENMNSFVLRVLDFLTLKQRKKSIQIGLSSGTPVPILYADIMELSRSFDSLDIYLVFKFMEKYGDTIGATGSPLEFLTALIRNVTMVACMDGSILAGGRAYNPRYDGFTEHVFHYCCRSAMLTLDGETSEHRFALLIANVINIPRQARKHLELILLLASEFALGHFLDFEACNEALAAYRVDRKSNAQGGHEVE